MSPTLCFLRNENQSICHRCHTFQHKRYISIARIGNFIMNALGPFFAETIPYCYVIITYYLQYLICNGHSWATFKVDYKEYYYTCTAFSFQGHHDHVCDLHTLIGTYYFHCKLTVCMHALYLPGVSDGSGSCVGQHIAQ